MTQYSHNAHLRREDRSIFDYDDVSRDRLAENAAEDLVRDLQGHGYLKEDGETIIDDFGYATVTLNFTAGPDGDLVVPSGTLIGTFNPDDTRYSTGDTLFVTDMPLTVPAGTSLMMTATASKPGRPYNVDAGELTHCRADLVNFASVTNAAAATGGADHQLTRAATYLTMSMTYMDLVRKEDDSFDYKRQLYMEKYKHELRRLVAAGIRIDRNNDGQMDDQEDAHEHGFHRLERG